VFVGGFMSAAIVGLCEIEFYLSDVSSLKEKRGILKSMLIKLRNAFNVSTAEVAHHDTWQSAGIAVVCVTNSSRHAQQTLQAVVSWIEENYPQAMITQQNTEILI